jgi:hypothetical protein
VDKDANEDAFDQLFLWTYISAIARNVNLHDCKADFVLGQPILESMTTQLKTTGAYIDDKNQYKSDGIVKLFGIKNLEILVLETSGKFSNRDKTKINFDHHKGMFGSLAMLKCIADAFPFGSVETFCKVKVFFLHAAGNINSLEL